MTQLLALLLALLALVCPPAALAADAFLCAGEPLNAELHNGAVDATGIPNSNGGTLPGAFIVIHWGELTLQLPRTNNAGTPSYSDGRWWWQAEDPDHPDLALLRGQGGDVEHYSCERRSC